MLRWHKLLFHGSHIGGLSALVPRVSEHGRPYVYAAENTVVAAIYLCNAVEKPYSWFPYGFAKDGVPVYHEIYPDAFHQSSSGKKGFIYEIKAYCEEGNPSCGMPNAIPFDKIRGGWVFTEAVPVSAIIDVPDAYEYLMSAAKEGRFRIAAYKDKTPAQRAWWHNAVLQDMLKLPANLAKAEPGTPEYSYSSFIKNNLPEVWGEYIKKYVK